MKIKLKKAIMAVLSSSIVLSMAACGGGATGTSPDAASPDAAPPAAGATTFTIANDTSEDTVTHLFTMKFVELAQEKSDNMVTFQVFSNGQMGSDSQILESVQRGDINFVVQTTAPQVNFMPKLAVFDLPNVFPSEAVARKVFDGPFLDIIKKEYEAAGFKLLGYADQGFRVMSTNKKVSSIDDFRGQKIRTMENSYHMDYWTALGANPSPMAFGEVYIALQQKTIDAQENPYEVVVSSKFFEQQDYVVNTNHLLHTISLVTNNDNFNALPAETQTVLIDAAKEAIEWARAEADSRKANRIQIIEDSGTEIVTLAPEVLEEMKARSASVYDKIKGVVGDEIYNGLLSEVEGAQ